MRSKLDEKLIFHTANITSNAASQVEMHAIWPILDFGPVLFKTSNKNRVILIMRMTITQGTCYCCHPINILDLFFFLLSAPYFPQ